MSRISKTTKCPCGVGWVVGNQTAKFAESISWRRIDGRWRCPGCSHKAGLLPPSADLVPRGKRPKRPRNPPKRLLKDLEPPVVRRPRKGPK